MKTILITGGAGFIGSHLIDRLIDKNNIICVDSFDPYYSVKIKKLNIEKNLHNKNFMFYEEDILSRTKLGNIFKKHKIDVIIHLAAKVGVRPSLQYPLLYERTNVEGTINLLDEARINKVNKFILASSSSVYGNSNTTPFIESMNVAPISPYASSKVAAENFCNCYAHLYKIQVCCLRLFTVYGPRQRPDLAIHTFTRCINDNNPISFYGDGSSMRDYTYVDDITAGITNAINYDKTLFEIINLGESRAISLKYLLSLLEKECNKRAIIQNFPIQKGDVFVTCANIKKAKRLLNYVPTTSIETGIQKFVAWYLHSLRH